MDTEKYMRTLLVVMAMLPLLALADTPDNRPPDNRPPDRTDEPSVTVTVEPGALTSESVSDASAASESVSEAYAEGGAGGAGGSSTVTFEGQRYRNTPTVIAPDVYPTVSCFRGMSGGAAGSGFGLSLGGGKIDESCVEREEIRLAAQMGLEAQALFRWCNLANNITAFGSAEACIAYSLPHSGEPEETVTHTELETYNFATEPEVEAVRTATAAMVREQIAATDGRVQRIEQRLDANAAAAAAAAREREQWKQELATKYLPDE